MSSNTPNTNSNDDFRRDIVLRDFQPGAKRWYGGNDEVTESIVSRFGNSFGITRLATEKSFTNKDASTVGSFRNAHIIYVCGVCSRKERNIPPTEIGCCGFKIKLKLQLTPYDHPFYEVVLFSFPKNSKHYMIRGNFINAQICEPVVHESQLTPPQLKLLKSLGKRRAKCYTVQSIMRDLHPDLKLDKDLMYRILQKGREEGFGDDDDTSMVKFVEKGIHWKSNGGSFQIKMCGVSAQLECWSGQTPLEKKLQLKYGSDVYFCDTTHNATKCMFKTGPIGVIDCFGKTAPGGIMQIPEEGGDVVDECLDQLGYNHPGTVAATDGGLAWPAPIEKRRQIHVEDTWHNMKNATEISGRYTLNPQKFRDDVGTALYRKMPLEELDVHLEQMRVYTAGTGEFIC